MGSVAGVDWVPNIRYNITITCLVLYTMYKRGCLWWNLMIRGEMGSKWSNNSSCERKNDISTVIILTSKSNINIANY